MRRMMPNLPIGVGLGWRRETAWAVARRESLAFTEVIAESLPTRGPLPDALVELVTRGVHVIPHGVSLSLGSGERPDRGRLDRLNEAAERLNAPFVSEHVAFVRGGGIETEHLLPVPRTSEALEVVVDNVRFAQDALSVPLVLENVAHLFEWPDAEMDEATFLAELTSRTSCSLLLDTSNLYANALNFGWNVEEFLDRLPLDHIAYVHAAGGVWCGGFYADTHAHPIAGGPIDVLRAVLARTGPLPVLLERDDGFGSRGALDAELDALESVLDATTGPSIAEVTHVAR